MENELIFQDPGEGLHEAEVLEVLVRDGDRIREGQPVFNVETDKAAFEVHSPRAGTVAKVRVSPGDHITVGEPLLSFAGESTPEQAGEPRAEPVPSPQPGGADTAEPGTPAASAQPPAPRQRSGPVPATPATRRLARELGVDLREVTPSGRDGRVLEQDVRAHAATREARPPRFEPSSDQSRTRARLPPQLPDFSRWGPVERSELHGARRTMAQRMSIAWSHVPHVNHQESVDITELEALRRRLAPVIEAQGGKLTLTVLVMRAAVTTLREFPRFNASFDAEHEQIIFKRYYRIGVAVDTDRGLIVPVVSSPESKSLGELARELVGLFERTRRGENSHDELTGGTFTLTNIGAIGGDRFMPIINYPEVAILGMARAALQPTVVANRQDHHIEPRFILPLSLSFDHRVIDGAEAARFMARLRERLSSSDQFLTAC